MRYFYYDDQEFMLYYVRPDFHEITKDLETFKKHMAIYPLEGKMLESFEVWEECKRMLREFPESVSHKNIALCRQVTDELFTLKKHTCWEEKVWLVGAEVGKVDFESMDEALDAYRKHLIKCYDNATHRKTPVPFKERLELIRQKFECLK